MLLLVNKKMSTSACVGDNDLSAERHYILRSNRRLLIGRPSEVILFVPVSVSLCTGCMRSIELSVMTHNNYAAGLLEKIVEFYWTFYTVTLA